MNKYEWLLEKKEITPKTIHFGSGLLETYKSALLEKNEGKILKCIQHPDFVNLEVVHGQQHFPTEYVEKMKKCYVDEGAVMDSYDYEHELSYLILLNNTKIVEEYFNKRKEISLNTKPLLFVGALLNDNLEMLNLIAKNTKQSFEKHYRDFYSVYKKYREENFYPAKIIADFSNKMFDKNFSKSRMLQELFEFNPENKPKIEFETSHMLSINNSLKIKNPYNHIFNHALEMNDFESAYKLLFFNIPEEIQFKNNPGKNDYNGLKVMQYNLGYVFYQVIEEGDIAKAKNIFPFFQQMNVSKQDMFLHLFCRASRGNMLKKLINHEGFCEAVLEDMNNSKNFLLNSKIQFDFMFERAPQYLDKVENLESYFASLCEMRAGFKDNVEMFKAFCCNLATHAPQLVTDNMLENCEIILENSKKEYRGSEQTVRDGVNALEASFIKNGLQKNKKSGLKVL